jgi:apolipoprotein N-acyltransferase
VICYESIYGDFVREYILNGADLIFIITNDGWWDDTPGYRQHLLYGRLRAIEMRRSIARSANTGISCFINQRGDILQKTGWWNKTAIKGTLNKNEEITFYARTGDTIGRVFSFLAVFLFLIARVKKFFSGRKKIFLPN